MKVAIMQPYFFPYIGYWQLIASCDEWVYFDEAQFSKRSWMTRNRIFHQDSKKDFQFINLGHEKVSFGQEIKAIRLTEDDSWKAKILSQLQVYKKMKAPHYHSAIELVSHILHSEVKTVTDQAVVMLQEVFRYLGLERAIHVSSQLEYERHRVASAGEWALEISKALGATEYINPTGGVDIFDEQEFVDSGIKLQFLKPKLTPYKQSWKEFHSGLSIIDILMFCDPEDVRGRLFSDYSLLSKSQVKQQVTSY